MYIFSTLCKVPADQGTWSLSDHIRLARVMYVANVMDQPNDSPDGKRIAKFAHTGVLPELDVFGCFHDKKSSTMMIRYLSTVLTDVHLDERMLDLLMTVANMPV